MITVDWNALPDWINYVAKDASGSWYGYAQAPTYIEHAGFWKPVGETEWEQIPSYVVHTSISSSDSLVARFPVSKSELTNEDLLKRLTTNPRQSDINEAIIRIFAEICTHNAKPQ